MRSSWLGALSVFLVVAGCIGTTKDPGLDDATIPARPDCPAVEEASAGTSCPGPECPPNALCADPPQTRGDACDMESDCGPTRSLTFAFEGRTGTGVCVALTPGHCHLVAPEEGTVYEMDASLRTLRVHATVEWTASGPGTEELMAYLLVDNGTGWAWDGAVDPSVAGTSPLQVDWDLARYAPGTRFAFGVYDEEALASPGAAYVGYVSGVAFRVAGEQVQRLPSS